MQGPPLICEPSARQRNLCIEAGRLSGHLIQVTQIHLDLFTYGNPL